MQNLIRKQNKEDPDKSGKKQGGNKNFNMIISIIMASVLWLYVLGEVNPETSVLIKAVSVQLLNVEELQDAALCLAQEQEYVVDVRIRGKHNEVSKIKSKDISAVADLAGAQKGNNYIPVSVTLPQGVIVDQIDPAELVIVVERIIKVTKSVNIQYVGEQDGDKEAEVVSVEPEKITLEGSESAIGKVERVISIVDLSKVTQDMSTELSVSPIDSQGDLVQGLLMDKTSVSAQIEMLTVKEVEFQVATHETAAPDENTRVRLDTYPKTINIKGKPEDLNGVDVVSSMLVDTSLIKESKEVNLVVSLPDNIYLSRDNPPIKAGFIVEKLETKTLTCSESDIEIKGLSQGLECIIAPTNIMVYVKDSAERLLSVEADTVFLSIDVTELMEGNHIVGIKSGMDETIDVIIDPENIDIIIKKKE